MKPLSIADIIDNEVQNLSGGELQRVAIALSLGKPADIYLIDEPSAYLDSEQVRRFKVAVFVRAAGGGGGGVFFLCVRDIVIQSKAGVSTPTLRRWIHRQPD